MDDETERQHLSEAEHHIHGLVRRIRTQQALLVSLNGEPRKLAGELLTTLHGSLRAGLEHRHAIRHGLLAKQR